MNSKEFYNKVVALRKAQKEYFKYRVPADLEKSKRLEKEIDDEIKRVQEIQKAKQNPTFHF